MVKPAGYDNDPVEEVEQFCANNGISTTRIDRGYGTFLRFGCGCIYDSNHKDAGALVFSNGAVAYSCPHDSCQEHKRWADAAAIIDPSYHPPRTVKVTGTTNGSRYRAPQAEPVKRDFSGIVARAAADIDFSKTPEPKQIVKGLITDGCYFLDAPSKTGKSRLLLQMLLAVCQGRDFLNRPTMQGSALYLALEDLHEDFETRLRLFCKENTPPANLYTLTKQDFPEYVTPRLGENGGLTDLIDCHMKQHPETLIIGIDVFSCIRGEPTSKDFTQCERNDIDELLRTAARYSIAVVVAHHVSKTGQQAAAKSETSIGQGAGSYSISGSVIGELSLIRDPDDRRFAILRSEGRRTKSAAIYLEDRFPEWLYCKEYGQKVAEDVQRKREDDSAALIATAEFLVNRDGTAWKGTATQFRQENEMNDELPQITCSVNRNTFEPIAQLLKGHGIAYTLCPNGKGAPLHWFKRCSTAVDVEAQDELPL